MAQLYIPGLVDFAEITITNTSGTETVNISNIVAELSYYEDIFSPAVSCSFMMVDAIALQSSLPISGGETFKLKMRAKGDDDADAEIETKLQIYKISESFHYNEKTEAYTVFATTEELLTNEHTNRLIRMGTNEFTIDKTANNIFIGNIQKVSNKKLVTLEETEGIFNYTFSSISPFRAMNMMCSQAKSAKNISSNFIFYETSLGYHFVTMQQLMKKKPIESYIYMEEIKSLQKRTDLKDVKDYQKIISSEKIGGVSLLEGSLKGAFSGIIKTLDVLAKSFFSKSYDYDKDFKSVHPDAEKENKKILTQETIKKFTSSPTRESFVTTNSKVSQLSYVKGFQPEMEQSSIKVQEFEAIEKAATEQILSQKINVMVHGNPRIHAGDTVNLSFPYPTGTEKGKMKNNDDTTGKYLVTAVVHRINVTHKYVTIMECVKGVSRVQPSPEDE